MRVPKSFVVAAILAAAVILVIIALAGFYFSIVRHVMTKTSPDGRHTAALHRVRGIDVNFNLTLDGNEVFSSPDFAPVDADFREQVWWSDDGDVVVLEVGGERLFGYNVMQQRSLTDDELLKAKSVPFDRLRYEGNLPAKQSN